MTITHESRPDQWIEAAAEAFGGAEAIVPERLTFLETFGLRFVQEIISDASIIYWRRRAETFEAARPRPGDFRGRATEDELEERDARLALKAEACRDRATLIEMGLLDG